MGKWIANLWWRLTGAWDAPFSRENVVLMASLAGLVALWFALVGLASLLVPGKASSDAACVFASVVMLGGFYLICKRRGTW